MPVARIDVVAVSVVPSASVSENPGAPPVTSPRRYSTLGYVASSSRPSA